MPNTTPAVPNSQYATDLGATEAAGAATAAAAAAGAPQQRVTAANHLWRSGEAITVVDNHTRRDMQDS